MRTVALLLLAATALAGCDAQPVGSNVVAPENAAVEKPGSLAGAFADPAGTVAKLNQFGYRLDNYRKQVDGSFAAKGAAIALSQTDAATPNRGTIEVTGKEAAAIDRIAFTLTVTDDTNAGTARERLAGIVRAFLFQYGVKDEGALDALTKEQDADGLIGNSPAAIAVDKGNSPRRITVTFQRPTATAPAEAAVQNKQP